MCPIIIHLWFLLSRATNSYEKCSNINKQSIIISLMLSWIKHAIFLKALWLHNFFYLNFAMVYGISWFFWRLFEVKYLNSCKNIFKKNYLKLRYFKHDKIKKLILEIPQHKKNLERIKKPQQRNTYIFHASNEQEQQKIPLMIISSITSLNQYHACAQSYDLSLVHKKREGIVCIHIVNCGKCLSVKRNLKEKFASRTSLRL